MQFFRSQLCCVALFFLLFFENGASAVFPTFPSLDEKMSELQVRRETLRQIVLPAAHSLKLSLEGQNAPTPQELQQLLAHTSPLETEEQIETMELLLERFFGPKDSWRNTLSSTAAPGLDHETILTIRTRTYLSSLLRNAERIVPFSPLSPEEIRALILPVIQDGKEVSALHDVYEAIFPKENPQSLAMFRSDIGGLLADIDSALPFLLETERGMETQRSSIARLQSHLTLVFDAQILTSWLVAFDAFAGSVLREAASPPFTILRNDLRALLLTLETDLQKLNGLTGGSDEAVIETQSLLTELSTLSEHKLHPFLNRLEDLLTTL